MKPSLGTKKKKKKKKKKKNERQSMKMKDKMTLLQLPAWKDELQNKKLSWGGQQTIFLGICYLSIQITDSNLQIVINKPIIVSIFVELVHWVGIL